MSKVDKIMLSLDGNERIELFKKLERGYIICDITDVLENRGDIDDGFQFRPEEIEKMAKWLIDECNWNSELSHWDNIDIAIDRFIETERGQ